MQHYAQIILTTPIKAVMISAYLNIMTITWLLLLRAVPLTLLGLTTLYYQHHGFSP